jgi:hypothetical protein
MTTDTQRPGPLSLTQAAKASGRAKSTLSRAIRRGDLSAVQKGNSFEIEPAELFRVFPMETDTKSDAQPPETEAETGSPQVKVEMLERLLEQAQAELERERQARAQEREDRLRAEARADAERARMDRLIEDQRPSPNAKRPSFLGRLLGA